MIATRARLSAGTRISDFWLAPHFAGDEHECLIEQSPLSQVVDERGKPAVEFREQVLLQASEIVRVRIPPAGALALIGDLFVLLPKDGDERHFRLDQPAGQKQAHAVYGLAIALADGRRLA